MSTSKKPKKQRKIVSADTGETVEPSKQKVNPKIEKSEQSKSKASTYRIIAVILWLLAIGFEVLAILMVVQKIQVLPLFGYQLGWPIVMMALDLIVLIIGSLLWKQANRYDPASEKNKIKFFLWNQLGSVVAIIAFLPLVIIILSNKNIDKKSKTVASIVAIVALVAGTAVSYDFDPVSSEDVAAMSTNMETLGIETVYWTSGGRVYHYDHDCQALLNSAEIFEGDINQAVADNKDRLCRFCERDIESEYQQYVDTENPDTEQQAEPEEEQFAA